MIDSVFKTHAARFYAKGRIFQKTPYLTMLTFSPRENFGIIGSPFV